MEKGDRSVVKKKNKYVCDCLTGKTERFIQPSLLLLLAQKPSYGYELIENLSYLRFHDTSPDPGAVYRYLRRMEEEGFVQSEWQTNEGGPAKRYYRLNPEGLKLLHQWAPVIKNRQKALDEFLEIYYKLFNEDLHP